MANLLGGDVPSPMISVAFRKSGSSISVALCTILYIVAFLGVQFWMRFKKSHNREFVECHKKAWIHVLNLLHVYLYNSQNIVTVIILWISTIAHIGTLVLCVTAGPRVKFFKIAMSASLAISLVNWLIHWLTRTFTRGGTAVAGIVK